MKCLSPSTPEAEAVSGELLNGSGFEAEVPEADFDPSEFLAEEDSEQ